MKNFLASIWVFLLVCQVHAAAPASSAVVLHDFKLIGDLRDNHATFTLNAIAHVENSSGGSLDLLSGTVALTEIGPHPKWRIHTGQNKFVLAFERGGDFPIRLKFSAAVQALEGWNQVDFQVAASTLQPIELQGLAADTQFRFTGAARPERSGNNFTSYLPADGRVKLAWKEARPETEGKLFYAAEVLSQVTLRPGLMRQAALLDLKVMQGEMNELSLRVQGAGELVRVQGEHVLAWNVEPISGSADRRLLIKLNQPQRDHCLLQVQMQTPLGAFPQTVDAMQLRPEGVTRYAGWIRIVNEGAVRLEVTQAAGLSQISPEQFPESDTTRALFQAAGTQRFAYRFSSVDYNLRIQADQILPELSVSEILAYNLGESELAIDAEIELDVREAPLRELVIRVPRGYALAHLNASGLSDYFLSDGPEESSLRLVYSQPMSGRQLIQFRLEHNQALGEAAWKLPRIEVARAKSVRGQLAVSADAGFRLTPEHTQGLTEIAAAFFPRKLAGIQAAFRLSDPAWEAALRAERLPQTIQADVFHLFSIGEGISYGSSVINYVVSGAPVSALRVELSDEYFNVEFTGKDIRNWRKVAGGYLVQLHTPVTGAYTLLASYERPFKPRGETLSFSGAHPLEAQSEQGHTLIISTYQFQVKPTDISPTLLALEPGEVPLEYRLFFDAPILAAYRYASRPFDLKLELTPRAQAESLGQIVDRASLTTRISKEGQIITDARYFVKNRGNPNFRVSLPPGTRLWSARVNGIEAVPMLDSGANLIPLPQHADPNAVLTVDLKLASDSVNAARVIVGAPSVAAPVMLAEWNFEPDTGRHLVYHRGSLTPIEGTPDISGFAGLARLFSGPGSRPVVQALAAALALSLIAVFVWRWTLRQGIHKFSARYTVGTLLGLTAFVLAATAFLDLQKRAAATELALPPSPKFLAPVQPPGSSLTVELDNLETASSWRDRAATAWPIIPALALFFCGLTSRGKLLSPLAEMLGWTCLAWSALRLPGGAKFFLLIPLTFLVLRIALPALRQLWQMPNRPAPLVPASAQTGAATVGLLILAGIISLTASPTVHAETNHRVSTPADRVQYSQAESVTQQIRIEEKFAFATAKIHWEAAKGQILPLLYEPAVLTHITFPSRALKLVSANDSRGTRQLLAQENGTFDIEVQYELQLNGPGAGFSLPTPHGLVNRVTLTLVNLDVDVLSSQAVSIQRETAGSNTVAALILSPLAATTINWNPRSRDVKREKPVFYSEIYQLYAPGPGVIEGAHYAAIRPAQGELGELIFSVPKGATITDVLDPANSAPPTSLISLWRFDPDTRKLRVNLNPPQSRPFALVIRSQSATGPLPLDQSVGLVSLDGAAGQIGLLGIGTGSEVQLDSVAADAFSAINLEDFPATVAPWLAVPGVTLHRAFRYADAQAQARLNASAVEPDVRVEMQQTLSLGEDRVVLAANETVDITRAGIFRLSFVLPASLDVESISGAALSHWTDLKTDAGRVITLHLRGKTEGRQEFALSLNGPGVKTAKGWTVPQLLLREASKQTGTLIIAPEQGMRLQVGAREGLTQLDPQKSGIRQKGVLAFRVLQSPWNLTLDAEQVEPWIQVTSLQQVTINEAQAKIIANLQYQIENTGLKSLRLLVPTNATGLRFQGEQIADFRPIEPPTTNGLQSWEVKLQRRIIGQYLLQVSYQTPLPDQTSATILRGIQAGEVNLQRGFLTVQSGGRLQLRVDALPASLQPTEWQSIPHGLQRDLPTAPANFTYRLVDAAFELPLKLERHEAAKLQPARVNNVTFTSVISDDGVMLTRARLEMFPGDKRLLELTLPARADFWFAFVDQAGVWPWRDQEHILIPLQPPSDDARPIPVELFYSTRVNAGSGGLNRELIAPKFDLPLENITWRIFMDEKWRLQDSSGSFQLAGENILPGQDGVAVSSYLENEASAQREKSKEAVEMLAMGNSLLEKGDPRQARRAFQSAYDLTQGDDAFNEDSRVQLNNLRLQQALVGLNLRQASATGDSTLLGRKFRDLRGRKEIAYTQQDAKDIIERKSAEENAAFMKLAERLVQQQDAAVNNPAAIHANIPEQGRLLEFKRTVAVDPRADLKINLRIKAPRAIAWDVRILALAGTALVCLVFGWLSRAYLTRPTEGIH